MKILLTLPGPLFPADTGGKIRSLNIFSRLAKRAEIHAVSFAEGSCDAAGIAAMKTIFASYTPVFRAEARKYSMTFYSELLANQFSSWPYFLAKCNTPAFRGAVGELAGGRDFDLVFCDFLQTAAPLRGLTGRPKVVFEHNVEFLLRKRKWQQEERPLRRLVYSGEWVKTRRIEADVCRSFDHVITVSDDDRQTLEREVGLTHSSTIPTGVDTEFFHPLPESHQPGRLVFVGSMDWDPNEDGAMWFLRDIFPRIRKAIPKASFVIVGRSPSPRLRAMVEEEPGVEVTGRVPDVRSYLAKAEVVVVPLRVGGGTRIKIPEAMAMAKAVVSTPIGAEGLPFSDGKQIRIAEQPEQFAQAVVELVNNASLRTSIACAARDEVVKHHGWEPVVARVQHILEHVIRQSKHASAA
jgi:sugar transferase (PEP-CTERM/EpsH1 system associated)